MKIITIDGKLQTTGTWDDTSKREATLAQSIARQRSELRAMLSGSVQFHEDPYTRPPLRGGLDAEYDYDPSLAPWVDQSNNAPSTPGKYYLDPDHGNWKSAKPEIPGVYIASISNRDTVVRYWDGKNWHVGVGLLGRRITAALAGARGREVDASANQARIWWLKLLEADAAVATWQNTPPPDPGIYIASSIRNGMLRRYWDGIGWSHGWAEHAGKAEVYAQMNKKYSGQSSIEWLRRVPDRV